MKIEQSEFQNRLRRPGLNLPIVIGRSFQRLFRLHYSDGVCESFEVLRETSLIALDGTSARAVPDLRWEVAHILRFFANSIIVWVLAHRPMFVQ